MPIGTTTAITAATRLIAPLVNDLYKTAKGGTAKRLKRWSESSFPRKLAKKIDGIGKVKTLWSPENEVPLLEFYYPPNIIGVDKRFRKPIESIKDIGEGNIVIQGIVGQGKSILLRYLAIQEASMPNMNRLPIFLELRTLQPGFTLISAIYRTLAGFEIDIDDESFEHLARSGRFILLLDAFDELDESLVRTTLNDISHLTQRYSELQIVVTSRPGNEIQKIGGFRVVRIAPITRLDYGPFLTKLGLLSIKIDAIKEAIRNSPSKLAELITTPLMLTLVVIVYESEKEIPSTLPEFFERLFQVVFTRHDRLKAGFNRKRHSGLSERRLQSLFEAFCFMVLQNSFGRSLTSEQFTMAFNQAVEYSDDCKCDEDKFRLDIVKVACLMLEEGLDISTFLHKSVLEYYAAAFIKHSTDEVASLFYKAASASPRIWFEVIRFLADIDPYRYSKEFAINELVSIRKEFIEPLKQRTDIALLKTICNIHSSFGASYQFEEDGEDGGESMFHISSFGPFNVRPRLLYESLDDLLIAAAGDALPNMVSQSQLEEILGHDIEETELSDEIEVPLGRIIAYAGSKEFWNAVDIFSLRIDKAETEATAIIANHDKRKLIFAPRKERPVIPSSKS